MTSKQTIETFLSAVRHQLRRRAAVQTALYLGAGLGTVAVAALVWAARSGPMLGLPSFWLIVAIMAAVAGGGVVVGLLRPSRRWRHDQGVARFVGRQVQPLASDLLSAVELTQATGGRHSPALVEALLASTAQRSTSVIPGDLVDWKPIRGSLIAAVSVAGALLALAVLPPGLAGTGWAHLTTQPPPEAFAGATRSSSPLVADIELRLTFPDYTHRAPVALPSASGDMRVLPGTRVEIEARSTRPIRSGSIQFEDDNGQRIDGLAPVALDVDGDRVKGVFRVMGRSRYRFLLVTTSGESFVDATPHTIDVEADRAPTVELHAPADELDVASLEQIELAYAAEDDYGIAKVELVWSQEGKQSRMLLNHDAGGDGESNKTVRTAGRRFLWDLDELQLIPGSMATYHLEVTDNDNVLGPNVGTSRQFTLRVYSRQERQDAQINKQRVVYEKLIELLAGRLTVAPDDVQAHTALHTMTRAIAVEIGTVLASTDDENQVNEKLVEFFRELRDRLDKAVAREARLLAASAAKFGRFDSEQASALEDDVLALADWIDRQQLESLLSANDEIEALQEQLKELLEEFARTGSEEVRERIQREIRALQRRIDELRATQQRLPEDVIDRFVNRDALEIQEQQKSCLDEVAELVAAGDAAKANEVMERCMNEQAALKQDMEDSLADLRGDNYSEEQKALEQLQSELSDLAMDQKKIADDTDKVWEEYAKQANEEMRDQAAETSKRVDKRIAELRRRVKSISERGMSPFAKDEVDAAKKYIKELEGLLKRGDLSEALTMAREIETALDAADAEMSDADEKSGRARETIRGIRKASETAHELVSDLEKVTPSPRDIMSPKERQNLDRLAKRQRGVRQRLEQLSKQADRMAEHGQRKAAELLEQAGEQTGQHMDKAEKHMRGKDPSGARQEAREAAVGLEKARKEMRQAARNAQPRSRQRDEPVRIPGADDYKAPEQFREDILDAMKNHRAPETYRELVKRYYEELIK